MKCVRCVALALLRIDVFDPQRTQLAVNAAGPAAAVLGGDSLCAEHLDERRFRLDYRLDYTEPAPKGAGQ